MLTDITDDPGSNSMLLVKKCRCEATASKRSLIRLNERYLKTDNYIQTHRQRQKVKDKIAERAQDHL